MAERAQGQVGLRGPEVKSQEDGARPGRDQMLLSAHRDVTAHGVRVAHADER
jgi:hypothetical protein